MVKNRTIDKRKWSEVFSDWWEVITCGHEYKVDETVGHNWDICTGVHIRHKCEKCGKIKNIRNSWVSEVPDDKIDESIKYHL